MSLTQCAIERGKRGFRRMKPRDRNGRHATLVHVAIRDRLRDIFTLDLRDFSAYRIGFRRGFISFPYRLARTTLALERPDDEQHGNGDRDDEDLERHSQTPVIAEVKAAGPEDERVVLVPDRR